MVLYPTPKTSVAASRFSTPVERLDMEALHPPTRRSIALPTGTLEIDTQASPARLDDVCEFAARINRKRGFLFVSRVLGRHVATTPRIQRQVWDRLIDEIGGALPGPVVFFTPAETAISMGHGVYRAYVERFGADDAVFMQSTRYKFDRPLLFEFSEEHSHASRHLVYRPSPEICAKLRAARTLVVVDDEMTTGRTAANVRRAFAPHLPRLEHVTAVVLTDWSAGRARRGDVMPVHSLLRGSYRFLPRPSEALPAMPDVTSKDLPRDTLLPRNDGRFGCLSPVRLSDAAKRAIDVSVGSRERVAVVGTGEFVTLPFLVAEHLESLGVDVYCHATSRSPALEGHAMRRIESFEDPCGDGIVNFLYNIGPDEYDRLIVCHETPPPSLAPRMIGRLPMVPIYL